MLILVLVAQPTNERIYKAARGGSVVAFRNEEIVEHQTAKRQTAKQPNVQTVKKTKQSTGKITNKEISENYHNLYLYISNVGIEQQTPVPIPSAQMNGLLLLW